MSRRYVTAVPPPPSFEANEFASASGGADSWRVASTSTEPANSGSPVNAWGTGTKSFTTTPAPTVKKPSIRDVAPSKEQTQAAFWAAEWTSDWRTPETLQTKKHANPATQQKKTKSGIQGRKKKRNVDIEQQLGQQSRYKTELCRSWVETGSCRYGNKCQFAHGGDELRPLLRHPKYKTEICKTFHTLGTCPYGTRCRFIHHTQERRDDEPDTVAPPPTPVNEVVVKPTLPLPESSSRTRSKSKGSGKKKKGRLPIFKLLSKGPREEK
eukprot:CAMPEP_0168509392 /NCGR_PEP_ID=MMETSP0405-20121227/744_1 /TAXON_ID=498012 /ORGANISM="Trichosphaerium sp, Strain Am-I-7 wt" /LENGTH=267 /DNA_ID=CAMNT_0008526833 /DNA_START=46 /DNA_END=850 /DNA_ORIENTATION=+